MKQPYEVFKALADETRLRILSLLSHAEMCVSDLDSVLQAGQSKVSRHLDYLKKTALVMSRRAGTMIFYRLDLEHDSMPHRVLEVWKEWGQTTLTGQQDWEKFKTLDRRRPKDE
jgi:ArsR family transcriptional regulator